MSKRTMFIAVAALFIGSALLFWGSSQNKQDSNLSDSNKSGNSSSEDTAQGEVNKVLKADQLKLPDSTYESINRLFKDYDNVQYGWSNSKQYVAFNLTDQVENENTPVLYIWKAGNSEPAVVKGAKWFGFGDFYWSPDDSYLLFDTGTDVARGADICWIKGLEEIERIGYIHKPVWAPDSKWIAMAISKSIQTVVDTSLEGSSDLIIYNIETKERRMIEEGTKNYFLTPEAWNKDGTLVYGRNFFTGCAKTDKVEVKPNTSNSNTITLKDQEEVEQLIAAFFKEMESRNYEAAANYLTDQGRLNHENTIPKGSPLWPWVESLKLISVESYLPSNIQVVEGTEKVPTVFFHVNLDIKYNKGYGTYLRDGEKKVAVNVVRENGKWKICYVKNTAPLIRMGTIT